MDDNDEWLLGNAASALVDDLYGGGPTQNSNQVLEISEADLLAESALQFLGDTEANQSELNRQQQEHVEHEQIAFEEAAAAFKNLNLQEAAQMVESTNNSAAGGATGTLVGRGAQRTGECLAEIVLICTSLGSVRSAFFGSRRADQLLACKGVPVYIVDVNRDVVTGQNLANIRLIEEWQKRNITKGDENGKLLVPQVIIDGVSIGHERDLQDLEEDFDLDLIFQRSCCARCLMDHEPNLTQCPHCGVTFQQLISDELSSTEMVVKSMGGKKYKGLQNIEEAITEPQPVALAPITKVVGFDDLFG